MKTMCIKVLIEKLENLWLNFYFVTIILLLLLFLLHLFSFVISCETAAWDIAATLWNN